MDRILLFLENKENISLLTKLLEKQYEIRSYQQGYSLEQGFDLCIADSLTYQQYQQQRQNLPQANNLVVIPLLLLTNQQELQEKISQLRQNIDEVILTPIIEEELLIRVEKLLRHRRLLLQKIGLRFIKSFLKLLIIKP